MLLNIHLCFCLVKQLTTSFNIKKGVEKKYSKNYMNFKFYS